MSYFAFWFVICMNHIAWSCRYTRSYEFDGTMIGIFKAERTYTWFLGQSGTG